jgi:hypothetical protein
MVDDFFEAAELFISTYDHSASEDPTTNENENEQWIQDTTMKLQLLRGWKKYESNHDDIELLLMSMEEVLEIVITIYLQVYILISFFRIKKLLWMIFLVLLSLKRVFYRR